MFQLFLLCLSAGTILASSNISLSNVKCLNQGPIESHFDKCSCTCTKILQHLPSDPPKREPLDPALLFLGIFMISIWATCAGIARIIIGPILSFDPFRYYRTRRQKYK